MIENKDFPRIFNSYTELGGASVSQRFAHALDWLATNYAGESLDPRNVVQLALKLRKRPAANAHEVQRLLRNGWHIGRILEKKYGEP